MKYVVVVVVFLVALAASANTPPSPPVIIEPAAGSTRTIDPGDVHMATAAFSDADAGDMLSCSDWEIRSDAGDVIWRADCVRGALAVHIHLGDGAFTNVEGHLLENTRYEVRVRFRDSSGDAATEWSAWSSRFFVTGAASTVRPLRIVDVLSSPPPRLHEAQGPAFNLPDGASIALQTDAGDLLLSFSATGGRVMITNPAAVTGHGILRVRVSSGATALALPAINIDFADQDAAQHTIYLPAIGIASNISISFWIAADGSSFNAFSDNPVFVSLARAADTPWTVSEPGYRVERVATGFQLPVNIAFVPVPGDAPDAPLFYVTELYGTIRVVLRDGSVHDYVTGLLNFDPTGVFPGSGEIGTVGTAVDPETGDLFVAVVYANLPGFFYPKVVRIHSDDGGRSASTITTILDMRNELIGASHQISSVNIGYDGMVYVHVGDGFRTELARDRDSFRGKIVRMDRNGDAPPSNPFFDASDGITAADYVFASGFRNPFGGAWRERDASLYEVENGPDTDRMAKVSRGMDYQWSGSDADMRVGAAYNWQPSVAPVDIAFVQRGTFGGSGYPETKFDHAFVSESGPTYVSGATPDGKRIREFAFNGSAVASTQSFVDYSGTGHATVAALAAGPDGLYFSDLYPEEGTPIGHGANVYRVRYVGIATIAAEVSDQSSRTVSFSANVTVPHLKRMVWDFGDGSTSTAPAPEHAFLANGPYDVRLSVIDEGDRVIDDFKRVQFPDQAGPGLVATYSDREGNVINRLDLNVDFDWSADTPPMQGAFFDVKWSGELVPMVSGLYTFAIRTEGNAILEVDGHPIIDTLDAQSAAMKNPIRLEAGHHYRFSLIVDDDQPGSSTQLLWSDSGLPLRVVPAGAFYPPPTRRSRAVGH